MTEKPSGGRNTPRLILLLLLLSILLGLLILFEAPSPSQTRESPAFTALMQKPQDGIAVIYLYGNIQVESESGFFGAEPGGSDAVVESLARLRDDRRVKAVVLRINSPGGTVAATQEIYEKVLDLKKAGKKVVASMAEVGASGAYYIASAADRIVVNPGTLTGSIGVIMTVMSADRLMEKIGIAFHPIISGKFKDSGSPFREMREEERKLFTDMAMEIYGQFFESVKKGRLNAVQARGLSEEDLKQMAQGQVFSGSDAVKKGLADELGTFEDARRLAWSLAGHSGEPPTIDYSGERFLRWLRAFTGATESRLEKRIGQVLAASPGALFEYRFDPSIFAK